MARNHPGYILDCLLRVPLLVPGIPDQLGDSRGSFSRVLSGNPASQWFLYGFMYTVVMGVMGIRMLLKYRGNRYQIIRTISVMFFQTAFAFLIPKFWFV
jgi:hypothetical protein